MLPSFVIARRCWSKLLWECKSRLNSLGTTNQVKVIWVPGHTGVEGNEKADELARAGAALGDEEVERGSIGVSIQVIKSKIDDWVMREKINYWNSQRGLAHSKNFIKPFDCFNARYCLSLTRKRLRFIY